MNMFCRRLLRRSRRFGTFFSLLKCVFPVIAVLSIPSFLHAEDKADIFLGSAETTEHSLDSTPRYVDENGLLNLEAEKIFEIDRNQSVIAVRTNTDGAAVFLNNEYQGTAPLSISALTAGIYELRLEKKGILSVHT